MAPRAFSEILLEGLAPDGGLVVPDHYPKIDPATLERWRPLAYADLAFEVIRRFVDDIAEEELRALVGRTYTRETFRSDAITPLDPLEPGLYLLRLANGPTLAFKDIAMQLLGNLFEHVLARAGTELNVLGATSGDTGSAAEHALRGKRGVRVFMLSPLGKTSAFQAAQMYSLQDPNIFNIAIRGVFDDCQDIVKAASGDARFKARHHIGTVNSINWGRVVAQIVYYFKGYFAAVAASGLEIGAAVSFAVPSGNFGNILAGHIARMMGLPIRALILATNENDVLHEFFSTGRYRVRAAAEVVQTSSPSMDISKASNFERFVYDLVGQAAGVVRELWRQVDEEGGFDLVGTPYLAKLPEFGFVSGSSAHADRLATIRDLHQRHGVLVDTHTADGIKVAREYRDPATPMVCLETAQPVKFAGAIREAIGRDPDVPPGYEGLEGLPQRVEIMDADVEAVKAFIARHAGG